MCIDDEDAPRKSVEDDNDNGLILLPRAGWRETEMMLLVAKKKKQRCGLILILANSSNNSSNGNSDTTCNNNNLYGLGFGNFKVTQSK